MGDRGPQSGAWSRTSSNNYSRSKWWQEYKYVKLWSAVPSILLFFLFSCMYSLWNATTQACLCTLCVTCARLLQDVLAPYWPHQRPDGQRSGEPVVRSPFGDLTRGPFRSALPDALVSAAGSGRDRSVQPSAPAVPCTVDTYMSTNSGSRNCCYWVGGLTALFVVFQCLVSPQTCWFVLERWELVLLTVALAGALELGGTPKAALLDSLGKSQILHSEGAAWLYFLGYLEIIFGENGKSFEDRMKDYFGKNKISQKDQKNTNQKSMFILLPMTRAALPAERSFHENDSTVTPEDKLAAAFKSPDGRSFGESQVYKIIQGGQDHRVSMEIASPLRSAAFTVDDRKAGFSETDYCEFAKRFLESLQTILQQKESLSHQVELVPLYDSNKLGEAVVNRHLELQERDFARLNSHAPPPTFTSMPAQPGSPQAGDEGPRYRSVPPTRPGQ